MSLPTKLVEALAAGRPLIASAGGDTARLVREQAVGQAAAPGDADALREAILGLLAFSGRDAMGRRARDVAERQFDRPAIVARLSGYLADVAGRSRS